MYASFYKDNNYVRFFLIITHNSFRSLYLIWADEYINGHIYGVIDISRGLLEFKLSNDPDLSARSLKKSSVYQKIVEELHWPLKFCMRGGICMFIQSQVDLMRGLRQVILQLSQRQSNLSNNLSLPTNLFAN